MNYIPNLQSKNQMLAEMGLKDMEDLFSQIPKTARSTLNLPRGEWEQEVKRDFDEIVKKNRPLSDMASFIGGGIYNHFIPAAIPYVTSRSEFLTAYTPYQPEISQGMLQSIFEFQSMVAELMGLDVANASVYDGATAVGEAALMCARKKNVKEPEFLVARSIHPDKRNTLVNMTCGVPIKIKEIGFDKRTGQVDIAALKAAINPNVVGFYFENPNFFAVVEENVKDIRNALTDALMVVGVHPLSLGIVKSPGEYGADIGIAEGQSLGNPTSFGGPLLGLMACKKDLMRFIPGRIVGMTEDREKRTGFVLTLQTREQHIRRAKATSNICSNEAHSALNAAVYLSLLGKTGIRRLGELLVSRTRELMRAISAIEGFQAPAFQSYHFNEFVIRSDVLAKTVYKEAVRGGVIPGLKLKQMYPELGESLLCCVTEMNTDEDFNMLLDALEYIGGK